MLRECIAVCRRSYEIANTLLLAWKTYILDSEAFLTERILSYVLCFYD